MLNTVILKFDRFEDSENTIFHNSSWKRLVVRFVLIKLRAA